MTETESALEVDRVRYAYPGRRGHPGRTAVDEVTFSAPSGQRVAMLGPNGSGKSTLLNIVCTMLPDQSGEVRVFGNSSARSRRERLSVVFQSNSLDPHLTVRENLLCQAQLYGLAGARARTRVEEELERARLRDRADSLVKTLSLGLSRRADLARALLHRPGLLLLDEPTAGLDPSAREAFLGTLERENREHGLTIVMSTHLVDEADRCDRVILLHEGRLVADGRPEELRGQLGARLVTVHAATPPAPLPGVEWSRRRGGWVAVCEGGGSDLRSIVELLIDSSLPFSVAPPTLADVFEAKTGAALDTHEPAMDAGASDEKSRQTQEAGA